MNQHKVVTVSLEVAGPHIFISAPSGHGASSVVRALTVQHLRRGGVCLMLDPKLVSHMWMTGLPNVAYPRGLDACHEALQWLSGEAARRAAAALEGNSTGPRLMVAAEHIGSAAGHFGGSPAAAGILADLHLVPPECDIRIVSTGSAPPPWAAQCGTRVIGRPSRAGWEALAPGRPYPEDTEWLPGRFWVVTSESADETQVVMLGGDEARSLVLEGEITPCPAGMPGAAAMGGE